MIGKGRKQKRETTEYSSSDNHKVRRGSGRQENDTVLRTDPCITGGKKLGSRKGLLVDNLHCRSRPLRKGARLKRIVKKNLKTAFRY